VHLIFLLRVLLVFITCSLLASSNYPPTHHHPPALTAHRSSSIVAFMQPAIAPLSSPAQEAASIAEERDGTEPTTRRK
jgi:hypothetical protein